MSARFHRRTVLAGLAGLAACDGRAESPSALAFAALKDVAPFPVGVCAESGQLADIGWRALVDRHFDRLTPEFEMKSEVVLRPDGGLVFDAGDRLASYAEQTGKRLHGHALIWYSQGAEGFAPLDGDRARFAAAYRTYIVEVAGRYRGRADGWDVVNEPVAEDGEGFRDCHWRRNLGMAYVEQAFVHAAEADPSAVRFLNEYNLESLPAKRRTFLRLLEDLLRRGAPVTGIGTQTHLSIEDDPATVRTAIAELGAYGLPVHVSELDISTQGRWDAGAERKQARLAAAVAEGIMALPPAQRYGLTLWGARDRDSWLTRPPRPPGDRPMLFDDQGAPKSALEALATVLAG